MREPNESRRTSRVGIALEVGGVTLDAQGNAPQGMVAVTPDPCPSHSALGEGDSDHPANSAPGGRQSPLSAFITLGTVSFGLTL